MRYYYKEDIIRLLPYALLARELPRQLQAQVTAPQRHVHGMDAEGDALLLMPAWGSRVGGVKIVNVAPRNEARGLPSVSGSYLLFDAVTGEHRAILEGGELTARRTAAIAAVAADRLAAPDARRLLLIGSGRIAGELAFAYRAVRPVDTVLVHSRTPANAERLAQALRAGGFRAEVAQDVAAAAAMSDIIACATFSQTPIVLNRMLRPGQHIALIGGYTADMREADDDLIANSDLWIDSPAALVEAGGLCVPLHNGRLKREAVRGTLPELCATGNAWSPEAVSVFKSVGDASQDLAVALLAVGDRIG